MTQVPEPIIVLVTPVGQGSGGGTQQVLRRMIPRWDADGHRITLLTHPVDERWDGLPSAVEVVPPAAPLATSDALHPQSGRKLQGGGACGPDDPQDGAGPPGGGRPTVPPRHGDPGPARHMGTRPPGGALRAQRPDPATAPSGRGMGPPTPLPACRGGHRQHRGRSGGLPADASDSQALLVEINDDMTAPELLRHVTRHHHPR